MPEYSLTDLAKLADVTPRTIRFYIAQGLLAPPGLEGPRTRYTDEHLDRLLAIKKLQAAHLPLAEIRAQLRIAGPQEVEQLVRPADRPPVSESAVEYIQNVLGAGPSPAAAARSAAQPMPSGAVPPASQPATTATPSEWERSQWDRFALTPDVELHTRRPLARGDQKRVLRLIEIARQLFKEE